MSDTPRSDEEAPIPARLVGNVDSPPSASPPSQSPVGKEQEPPASPTAPHFDERPASFPVDLFEQASATPAAAPHSPRPGTTPRPAPPSRRASHLDEAEHVPRPRRRATPIVLFVLTCVSTFWAWCGQARPDMVLYWVFGGGYDEEIRAQILAHWQGGLIYMACVLAILFAHEMGHFLMTLRYRVAASWPYFLPVPFSPIGTMGAVISMDGLSADRRQIFDIGIAGPLAGLVVAIPIAWYGAATLDLTYYDAGASDLEVSAPARAKIDKEQAERAEEAKSAGEPAAQTRKKKPQTMLDKREKGFAFHMPWMISKMVESTRPIGLKENQTISAVPMRLMNPYLMAGWVGLLITGLNMMPISQLDGGHVIYGLFGKRAHVIARVSLFVAIFLVVFHFNRAYLWTVMLLLVTLMGTDHPPTANDDVPLGRFRTILGWASLSIPFLCFPFFGLWQLT